MKEDTLMEGSYRTTGIESILDLNANNVWDLNEHQIAELWERERMEEDFSMSEEKLLNIIRLAFDVNHYSVDNERDVSRFETGWAKFVRCNASRGAVAIRRKTISRVTDLSYENVKHISASVLLDLIDKNFGGGWESLSLAIRDIIESGFDISTTQLPASRIHKPGGTLEKKVEQGYDVLEITKGTWVEAIFAKKKDPVAKLSEATPYKFDEEDTTPLDEEEDEQDEEQLPDDDLDEDEDNEENDETFYSSYSAEADVKPEDEEGFPVEEED